MQKSFWKSGHTPTLLTAFLYFDLSFMTWYLLSPLQKILQAELGLSVDQRALVVATPILAGALMRYLGYHLLFAYSAIFAFLSYITMNFVRHGDNKIVAKKGLEAYDVED